MTRDENGRFGPGNNFGKGRPRRVTETEYLNVTIAEISLKDWKSIVTRAKIEALKGDRFARQWLGDYLIGKPPQIFELHGQDALLLSELLHRLDSVGMSPGEVFNAMLATIAEMTDDDVEVKADEE